MHQRPTRKSTRKGVFQRRNSTRDKFSVINVMSLQDDRRATSEQLISRLFGDGGHGEVPDWRMQLGDDVEGQLAACDLLHRFGGSEERQSLRDWRDCPRRQCANFMTVMLRDTEIQDSTRHVHFPQLEYKGLLHDGSYAGSRIRMWRRVGTEDVFFDCICRALTPTPDGDQVRLHAESHNVMRSSRESIF